MQQRFSFLAQQLRRFERPVLIVDLEATGGDLSRDRITEIAFLRFHDGRVSSLSQLIDPQQLISPFIAKLTGIGNDTVAAAPTAADFLPTLLPHLQGCLMIAHNSRFDHTLLANEYARLQHIFILPALCSVKLSQTLYPLEEKHSLDAVAARFGITPDAGGSRHRAMTDVLMLAEFLQKIFFEHQDTWFSAAQALIEPPLPPHGLSPELQGCLNALPDQCGLTVWHRAAAAPAAHVCAQAYRDTVRALHRHGAHGITRIDFQAACGRLHAECLRARHLHEHGISENLPPLQRHAVVFYQEQGCLKAKPRPLRAGFHAEPPHGLFRHGKAAAQALTQWAAAHRICPEKLGIGTCGGRCADAACRRADPAAHNRQVRAALPFLRGSDAVLCRDLAVHEHGADGRAVKLRCRQGALEVGEGLWYVSEKVWEILYEKHKKSRQNLSELPPPALASAFANLKKKS